MRDTRWTLSRAAQDASEGCRVRMSRGMSLLSTLCLVGETTACPTYVLSRWLFLRLLGVIYLIAFVSLWTQIRGLVGSQGILPAESFLQVLREQLGSQRTWIAPNLFWWIGASDAAIQFVCFSGVVLSVVLIIGIAPVPALVLLWISYLSLTVIGQDFLEFQWDILLLEVGFLAIFLAPLQLFPSLATESPPSRIVLVLLWWLIFRFMLESGLAKLLSGDPAWRNLTALTYHYETQPLPTFLGWYVHQLPLAFHKFSLLFTFFVELIVPFVLVAVRPLRLVACALLVLLQVVIVVTGNYGFFNLLTIALSLLLLDDAVIRSILPTVVTAKLPEAAGVVAGQGPVATILQIVLAIVVLSVSGGQLLAMLRGRGYLPSSLQSLVNVVSPFRTINRYGLFAVMTKSRPEIVIEGSSDGVTWLPYEFKYKPGDLSHPPGFVAPHMPRLDWQMWFAALGGERRHPWFRNFLVRLLQDSPDVLSLLKTNPFPDRPPRYVRALLYDYRFTDRAAKRSTGAWWRRELRGTYSPVLSLEGN